jgi:hypothetical protein
VRSQEAEGAPQQYLERDSVLGLEASRTVLDETLSCDCLINYSSAYIASRSLGLGIGRQDALACPAMVDDRSRVLTPDDTARSALGIGISQGA